MEKEMTYQEALKLVLHGKYADADEMIIEAIEKQIPKTVKNKGYLGRINAENIYYGECPACGKAVGSASCKKWCDQCGQSVDWG